MLYLVSGSGMQWYCDEDQVEHWEDEGYTVTEVVPDGLATQEEEEPVLTVAAVVTVDETIPTSHTIGEQ